MLALWPLTVQEHVTSNILLPLVSRLLTSLAPPCSSPSFHPAPLLSLFSFPVQPGALAFCSSTFFLLSLELSFYYPAQLRRDFSWPTQPNMATLPLLLVILCRILCLLIYSVSVRLLLFFIFWRKTHCPHFKL